MRVACKVLGKKQKVNMVVIESQAYKIKKSPEPKLLYTSIMSIFRKIRDNSAQKVHVK